MHACENFNSIQLPPVLEESKAQIEEPKNPNIVLFNDGRVPLKNLAQKLLNEVNKGKLKPVSK